MSFRPYLSLVQTLLHVLKWVLWRCQQISTRITKYMHFILQLKAHKSIPDTTKPALQWLKSRIFLQLWTFCVSLFIRDLRFDWSQQDFLLCVNWITVHATNIYTANDVDGTCHLHFSHITKPSLSEAATFTAPRCETTIDPLMLDKRTVSCCKLSRQNTHARVCANTTTADSGSFDKAGNVLCLLVLWSLSCARRPTFRQCRLCACFRCLLRLKLHSLL